MQVGGDNKHGERGREATARELRRAYVQGSSGKMLAEEVQLEEGDRQQGRVALALEVPSRRMMSRKCVRMSGWKARRLTKSSSELIPADSNAGANETREGWRPAQKVRTRSSDVHGRAGEEAAFEVEGSGPDDGA